MGEDLAQVGVDHQTKDTRIEGILNNNAPGVFDALFASVEERLGMPVEEQASRKKEQVIVVNRPGSTKTYLPPWPCSSP